MCGIEYGQYWHPGANASNRRTKTKAQYEQWLKGIEQQVKEVMQQADSIDKGEDEKYGDDRVRYGLLWHPRQLGFGA